MNQLKENIVFSQSLIDRINELISHYPEGKQKSALLPILHEVQDAYNNWLSVGLMDKVAEILHITPIEVYEVASFYSMYNQKPMGKYLLEFCQTSPCCLRGTEDLMEYTCEKLGVKLGETTKDGLFTVKGVECLGACGYAPMLQLGDFYYEKFNKVKIDQLIEDCKANQITLHDKS
jgi:NADH-quinone oxidoreductase subunit E